MTNVSLKIEGLKSLEQKLLKTLPAAVGAKVLRGAAMDALTPIVKAAKAKVPVKTGELRKAISKSTRVNKSGSGPLVEAGIVMRSSNGKAGWRWHFTEFGTLPHNTHGDTRNSIGRGVRGLTGTGTNVEERTRFVASLGAEVSGDHPGHRAQPFLRPAWDEQIRPALARFNKRLRERIRKELARAPKRR